jgi:hypothetical protein
MPDPMPLGLTLFFVIVLAIVLASFVNKSLGGAVETVFTFRAHFFVLVIAPSLYLVNRLRVTLWLWISSSKNLSISPVEERLRLER